MEEKLEIALEKLQEIQEKLNKVLNNGKEPEIEAPVSIGENPEVEDTDISLDEKLEIIQRLLEENEEDYTNGIALLVVVGVAAAIALPFLIFFI